MDINLKINSINDFNNNLTVIKSVYNLNNNYNKLIEDFIYDYIYNELKNILNNIKIKNLNRLLNKLISYNPDYNLLTCINDLSNLLTDNYIEFNFYNDYGDKLNKIFIYKELLNIIDTY